MCVGLWMMLYILCLSNFTNLIQLNETKNKGTDSHRVYRFPFWREHCTTSKCKWDSKNKMHTSPYVLFHSHRRAKMTVFHTYHRPLFLIFACVLFQTSVMWQNWISPLYYTNALEHSELCTCCSCYLTRIHSVWYTGRCQVNMQWDSECFEKYVLYLCV